MQQNLNPNGTVSNTNWTGSPNLGSLNLHLNLDDMNYGVDGDTSDYVTSFGPSSKFRLRLDNPITPTSGKKWSFFRVRVYNQRSTAGGDDGLLAVTLLVDDIVQNVSSFVSKPLIIEGTQTDWIKFKSNNYTQVQLDRMEVLFSFTAPSGFFQGDVDIFSVQVQLQDAYIETGVGGAQVGGSAASSVQTYLEEGSGGLIVNGSSDIGGTSTAFPDGGVKLGSNTIAGSSSSRSVSGGIVASGEAFNSFVYNFIINGGALIYGSFDSAIVWIARGGVEVAGNGFSGAMVGYRYNSNVQESIQLSGSSVFKLFIKLPTGGTIFANGSSGVKASYKYNASGGLSVSGSSGFALSRVNQKEFTFNIRSKQNIEPLAILWNTGRIPLSHFRIISKCLPESERCQPISDPQDLCNRKTVVTLTAATPADVCRQLSERGFRFPIVEFDRFSRPAETSLSTNNECNELIPVEFCEIPECLDFCVDFDFIQLAEVSFLVGFTSSHSYLGSGNISLGGIAEVSFSPFISVYTEIPEGGIIASGTTEIISSTVKYIASGGFEVRGTVGGENVKTSSYNYIPVVCPQEINNPLTLVSQSGDGFVWSDENRVLLSDNLRSYVQIDSTQKTQRLIIQNPNLSIPSNKIINGITVEIERDGGTNEVASDDEIILVSSDGIVSENKAKSDLWVSGDNAVVYGANNDNWGRIWSPSEVNDEQFGILIRVKSNTVIPQNIYVDSVKISVAACEEDNSGKIDVSGSAIQKSSNYIYQSSGGTSITGNSKVSVSYSYMPTGSIFFAGSYTKAFSADVGFGGIQLSGSLGSNDFKSSIYDYENFGGPTGGVELTSEFEALNIISSGWTWVSEGGVSLTGSAGIRVGYIYEADNTSITISGNYERNFHYFGEGGVTLTSNNNIPVFSNLSYSYEPSGGIEISSSGATIKFSDLGILDTNANVVLEIVSLEVIFGSSAVDEIQLPVDTVITSCGSGCLDLPLSISFDHNIVRNNKLSQFLVRNSLSMNSTIFLNYNKVNDRWQSNFHFKGVSAFNHQESWNIVFELQCSSFIGGTELGQPMLRLGASIFQKNLTTGEDYDTKVMVVFNPTSVCNSEREFIFDLTIDVLDKSALINPSSSIQDAILYDNIGLFKNSFWYENPSLVFSVSEVGIEPQVSRIDISRYINY